jgi:hypothetical protein
LDNDKTIAPINNRSFSHEWTLENTEGAIKMEHQQKPATQGTQDEDKQNKNIT